MRSLQTPLEARLWHHLRAKRFTGAKFRRQVVVGRYIVDFACRIPSMLVIEIDGDSHALQRSYDEQRTAFLESKGYRMLRFANHEIAANLYGVLTVVAMRFTAPSPRPSPLKGRGGR